MKGYRCYISNRFISIFCGAQFEDSWFLKFKNLNKMSKNKKNAHAVRKALKGSKTKKSRKENKKSAGKFASHPKKKPNRPSYPCSESFQKIVPELSKLGWQLFPMYTENTSAGVNGKPEIFETQALVLKNDSLSFTLTSYLKGVSISKIEVWNQDAGKIEQARGIVVTVLKFLQDHGVDDIYALTRQLGHIKEYDVVLNENELDQIFRSIGFADTEAAGRLIWSNKENLLSDEHIDDSILIGKREYKNTGDGFLFFKGQVQVFFEFVHQPNKNFVKTFCVETDDEIKKSITRFIYSSANSSDQSSTSLGKILSEIVGRSNVMPKKMASTLFQSFMAVSLAQDSKEDNYEREMSNTASFFIPVLHLLLKGNESNIAQYRLVFDEVRETMDIATRTAAC